MLEIAAENEKTALEDVTEYSATDFCVEWPPAATIALEFASQPARPWSGS